MQYAMPNQTVLPAVYGQGESKRIVRFTRIRNCRVRRVLRAAPGTNTRGGQHYPFPCRGRHDRIRRRTKHPGRAGDPGHSVDVSTAEPTVRDLLGITSG